MGIRWVLFGLLVGCDFPIRSEALACAIEDDCPADRTCRDGFCVAGERSIDAGTGLEPDAVIDPDAPADAEVVLPPDADPFLAIAEACLAAGYTEEPTTGGLYRQVTAGKPWLAAQADCKDDVPDATHLIVLSTTAEVDFMATRLGWIGLSDRAAENTFVTVTGETDDQRPFANGQPDNGSGTEDCVEMKSGGLLDDDQCDNSKRYVCECDGRASTP